MKKIMMLLAALGIAGVIATPAVAGPAEDLKQFRDHFKKKFPNVKFDEYANGLYALPGFDDYRAQWEAFEEFPPYELGFAEGKKTWDTPFANGKTFASCFKNGGKKIAQNYPYWDDKSQKVRTAEMDIIDCAKKNESKLDFVTADLSKDQKARVHLANVTAYFYSLSKGQRVSLDLSKPGAVKAYEEGKKFWWTRRGQLNFACSHCHVDLAGKNFGGGQPLSAGLGHPVGWPAFRTLWGRLETIHERYRTCLSQGRAKPFPHGAEIYNSLQLYETYMSSGLPLTAPSMRN